MEISAKLRSKLDQAKRVFVLTGAGVSAESGVPTFRSSTGELIWKGLPFSVVSSAEMLQQDPDRVWEWFEYRRSRLRDLTPNPAHHAISRWQERFENLSLATQNVDGLHQAAGSANVIELHGNIWKARCLNCGLSANLKNDVALTSGHDCPDCSGKFRTDVVLLGESLDSGLLETAFSKASGCDICFVIGTSAVVYPAAGLPLAAKRSGAFVVEVNCERTALSADCDEVLLGPAGDILPLL